MPDNRHAGFGKQPGETHQWQHRQGASGRLRLSTATVELWMTGHVRGGNRWKAWLAFSFGIVLSLYANITSAPELAPLAIAVAAYSPLALLLAVELLNRTLKRRRAETSTESTETERPVTLPLVSEESRRSTQPTAEQLIWAYYPTKRAKARTPTGPRCGH